MQSQSVPLLETSGTQNKGVKDQNLQGQNRHLNGFHKDADLFLPKERFVWIFSEKLDEYFKHFDDKLIAAIQRPKLHQQPGNLVSRTLARLLFFLAISITCGIPLNQISLLIYIYSLSQYRNGTCYHNDVINSWDGLFCGRLIYFPIHIRCL